MNKSDCAGCRNDFYNHRTGFDGATECWSFKDAKIGTLYSISPNAPQDNASNFVKVRKPLCYHQDGWCYYPRLPDHLLHATDGATVDRVP